MITRFSENQINEFVTWIEKFSPDFFLPLQYLLPQQLVKRVEPVLRFMDTQVSSLFFTQMLKIMSPVNVWFIASRPTTAQKIELLKAMIIREDRRNGKLFATIEPEVMETFRRQVDLEPLVPNMDFRDSEIESDHTQEHSNLDDIVEIPAPMMESTESEIESTSNHVGMEKPPVPNVDFREAEKEPAMSDLFHHSIINPEATNLSSQETPGKQSPQSKTLKNNATNSKHRKTVIAKPKKLPILTKEQDEDFFQTLNPIVDMESSIVSPQKPEAVSRSQSLRKTNVPVESIKSVTAPVKRNAAPRQVPVKNKVPNGKTIESPTNSPNKRKSVPRRSLRTIKDPIESVSNSPQKVKTPRLLRNNKNPVVEKILSPKAPIIKNTSPRQLPKKPKTVVKNKSVSSSAGIRKVISRRSLKNIKKPIKDILSSTRNLVKRKVVSRQLFRKTTKPTIESIVSPRSSQQKRAPLPSQPSRNTKPRLEEQPATTLSNDVPIHTTTQDTFTPFLQELNHSPLVRNSIFMPNAASKNEAWAFINETPDFSSFMVPLPPGDLVLPPNMFESTVLPQPVPLPDNNHSHTESNFFPRPPAPATVNNKNLFSKFSLKTGCDENLKMKFGEKRRV